VGPPGSRRGRRRRPRGRERWTYDADDELQGPPIVADGSLYVVGDEYSLHALTDPSTE